MEKKLFREQYETSPLTYITDPKRFKSNNAIARLEGIGGSWKKATRNGRLYGKRLWENIINSDSFKEGMATHTIFAETDHPEERIEISLKEVAGVLTDLEIENDGTIFTGFDILPTPNGKLLKVLLDYGCKIGTSSRGLGDEIIIDGVNQIDPDTYEYYCHDFVVCPAVEEARLTEVREAPKTESLEKTFASKILEEANSSNNAESLRNLKEIVESTSVADKATLVETISNKLSSLSESTDEQGTVEDESDVPDTENDKTILLGSLEEKQKELEACKVKLNELKELLSKRNENASYFRKAVQEQRSEIAQLTSSLEGSCNSNEELSKDYEDLKKSMNRMINGLTENLNNSKVAYNSLKSKHDNLISVYQETKKAEAKQLHSIKSLEDQLTNSSHQMNLLKSDNDRLKIKIENLNRAHKNALTESKSQTDREIATTTKALTEARHSLKSAEETIKILQTSTQKVEDRLADSIEECKIYESKANAMLEKYLARTCEVYGITVESLKSMLPKHYDEAVIDQTAKQLSERQQRFDAMPIAIPRSTGRIIEHKQSCTSDENAPSFIVEALKRGAN